MRARDHASKHFDEMSRFAARLADLRGQVLDYSYSYLALGSWTMTFRLKKRVFRIRYDGRKQLHVLERSSARHSPHDWATVRREASLNTEPPPGIINVILDAVATG